MRPVPGRRPITNFGGPRGPRPGMSTPFGPRPGIGPRPGMGGPRVGDPRLGAATIPGNKMQMQMRGRKKGGEIKTKSFPDLTGDGKVTMKDILKGRGAIKKKGGAMKKADGGLIRMHKQMAMSTKKFT